MLSLALGNFSFVSAQSSDMYYTEVTFPANFAVGDYIEFAQAQPYAAGSSGFYEISIAYTRGNVAAAATHIASASHLNSDIWRETGRINNNIYTSGAQKYNFTIDVNPRKHGFRIRAVNTLGVTTDALRVHIKIRSINHTAGFTSANISGHTDVQNGFLSMTSDWELIVGDLRTPVAGVHAIKVIPNGYVGIGTTNPTERLSVDGTIRAKEIKVEAGPWPDYVFQKDYPLAPLSEVEQYIQAHGHLPAMPSAATVEQEGVSLGLMNKLLLEKVEELTLHLIEKDKALTDYQQGLLRLEKRVQELEKVTMR